MSKKTKRKITSYSITVFTKDGKMTGSGWYDKLPQVKRYMKRKLKSMDKEPQTVKVFTWREGDTLDTCKERKIRRL